MSSSDKILPHSKQKTYKLFRLEKKQHNKSIRIFASFSTYVSPYVIPAPITKDNPIEITIDINPTARLSFSISSSILNFGVKNSKIK